VLALEAIQMTAREGSPWQIEGDEAQSSPSKAPRWAGGQTTRTRVTISKNKEPEDYEDQGHKEEVRQNRNIKKRAENLEHSC